MFRISTATVLLVGASLFAGSPSPRETLKASKEVLEELTEKPTKAIPLALMKEAEAIVIFPTTIKAGFVVGGRVGHGVAIIKDEKTGWGDVRFLDLGGASVGFQIGVESTDVVLVFKNRKGLERILDGKAKLKLGADASVAAGPVGREAQVATDGKLQSEIFSYSRSRGLFAGVSLEGVVLSADGENNTSFEKDNSDETKKAADELKSRISLLSVEKAKIEPVVPLAPAPQPVVVVEQAKPVVVVEEPRVGPVRKFLRGLRK